MRKAGATNYTIILKILKLTNKPFHAKFADDAKNMKIQGLSVANGQKRICKSSY